LLTGTILTYVISIASLLRKHDARPGITANVKRGSYNAMAGRESSLCWAQRMNWRERGWWNNENGLLTPGVLIAPFLRTTIFLISARV